MIYRVNVYQFFSSMRDHILRIQEAEEIKGLWKTTVILILLSMFVYGWMAYVGMGTDHLSKQVTQIGLISYEQTKFWFLVGRVCFGLLFALFFMFIVPLILFGITDIPYKKLMILGQVVLTVLLCERIIWIPLFVYAGLDWSVSPFSLGIIASYMTDIPWLISFFGAISVFQALVIWLQVKFIKSLSTIKYRLVWLSMILLHIFYWLLAAFIVYLDLAFLGGVM